MENMGQKIRRYRVGCGLKVYELAKKVGVNPVYITQIEKHNKFPSPAIMKKITDLLAEPGLFRMYLKLKYPLVYKQVKKEDAYRKSEFREIEKEFTTNEYTAEADRKLQGRISIYEARVRRSEANLKKIRELHLKIKNTAKQRARS